MPTPKPGQIRCPTCQQPTPQAAYCTQCGAPLPSSLQVRPRGMDRSELEERARHRRPGDPGLRRGRPAGDDAPPGYVPFQPEPGDANAVREVEGGEPVAHVDNTPPDFDIPPPTPHREPAPNYAAAAGAAGYAASQPPPAYEPDPYGPPPAAATYGEAPVDEEPYGAPEDAYPYTYPAEDGGGRRGGGSALPVIGFILLGVLALAIGALLATLLGGNGGVGEASPTPTVPGSVAASASPSTGSSAPASEPPSSTPAPTDGPVIFPDGGSLSIQPCSNSDYVQDAVGHPDVDACDAESEVFPDGELWAFVVFNGIGGSDTLTVQLLENDAVQNEQELTVDSVLGECGSDCNGLIYGAHYVDLFNGDYKLILLRNGEFADSATFTVGG